MPSHGNHWGWTDGSLPASWNEIARFRLRCIMGSMKPAPLLSVFLALVAGVAAGYFWGAAEKGDGSKTHGGLVPALTHSTGTNAPPRLGTRDEAANSFGEWLQRIVVLSPAALEETLRRTRRDFVLGDAGSILKQQLLLHFLATVDSGRALRVAREFDFRGDGSATSLVLSAMAAHDPRAAAALVTGGNGLSPEPHAALSARGVAAAWARQDATAAQQWARTLPEGLRLDAWSAIASVMAASDPAGAAVFTLEMPAGPARMHSCAAVAEVWARTAPSEALTWVSSLPAEERHTASPAALKSFAETDPVAAAAWLLRQPPPEHLPQNTAALMGGWARSDPAAAAQWVAGLSVGPVQTEAMQHLLYQWSASAPEEASTWLRAQPESPARDEAVAMLSLQVSATDPEAAAVWASTISDPARRSAELHRSLAGWLRKDDAAARQWMQEAGVSIP